MRQGDERKARVLFEDSLKLFTESNNKFMVTTCLAGFAGVMAIKGGLENAAQLFGAAEHSFESFSSLEPADQKDLDHYVELVRKELHRTTLATAWAKGRTMTLEQAISFALWES